MLFLLTPLALASPVDLALGEAVHDLALSPDGEHLAVADAAHLTIRDADTLALVWAPSVQWDRWRRVHWQDDHTLEATHVSGATYAFDLGTRSITPLPTRSPIGDPTKVEPLHIQAVAHRRTDDPLRDYDRIVGGGFPLLPEGRTPVQWFEEVPGAEDPFAVDDLGALHGRRDDQRISSPPLGAPIQSVLLDDERVVVVHDDGRLTVLDASLQPVSTAPGPRDGVASAVAMGPKRRLAWIGRPDGGLELLDLKRGRVRAQQPPGRGLADVATADHLVLTSDVEGATLWDTARGEQRWTMEGPFQQIVLLRDESVLLGLDGRATWVDGRGRTVREVCVTVDCEGKRPAFLATSRDDRLVVLEPSYIRSPTSPELQPGRVSVWAADGALQVTRTIDHEPRERPRLGDTALYCAQRKLSSMLDLLPSPLVDMDFAVRSEVLLCDQRLALDTLEVVGEQDRRRDEVLLGSLGTDELSLDVGSTTGTLDAVWVTDADGERTMLVDPNRQARFGTTARWEGDRLVLAGTGLLGAGGVLRYVDLSTAPELPWVKRPGEEASEPVPAYVVDQLPDARSGKPSEGIVGPAGRLTWTLAANCDPWSEEELRERAPAALEPAPVHTAEVVLVRTRAIDGHAFPGQLERIASWLEEGLAGAEVVARIEAMGGGLWGSVDEVVWEVGRRALPAELLQADASWQPLLEKPLVRSWVRRGPSRSRERRRQPPTCWALSLDGSPVGTVALAEGSWAATEEGFLYASDIPLFVAADGTLGHDHPACVGLANHYVGVDDASKRSAVAVEGDTLVLRVADRLLWVDLGSGSVTETLAPGRLPAVVLHDGAAWVVDRQDQIVAYGPDGEVRNTLHAPTDILHYGRASSHRVESLAWRDGALWTTVRYKGFFRWNGETWQEVVAGP